MISRQKTASTPSRYATPTMPTFGEAPPKSAPKQPASTLTSSKRSDPNTTSKLRENVPPRTPQQRGDSASGAAKKLTTSKSQTLPPSSAKPATKAVESRRSSAIAEGKPEAQPQQTSAKHSCENKKPCPCSTHVKSAAESVLQSKKPSKLRLLLSGMNRSSLHAADKTPSGPFTVSEVLPFLYIGGINSLTQLKKLKIKAVLTVCEENIRLDTDIRHMSIAILDDAESSLRPRFETATDFIEHNRRAGRKVLVHCLAGISRSATLILAYLMRYQRLTLRAAYLLLKAKRPIVRPNMGFFKQLAEYEQELFGGKSTVKLISPYPNYPTYKVYDVCIE